jgi:hypothetical protein
MCSKAKKTEMAAAQAKTDVWHGRARSMYA